MPTGFRARGIFFTLYKHVKSTINGGIRTTEHMVKPVDYATLSATM